MIFDVSKILSNASKNGKIITFNFMSGYSIKLMFEKKTTLFDVKYYMWNHVPGSFYNFDFNFLDGINVLSYDLCWKKLPTLITCIIINKSDVYCKCTNPSHHLFEVESKRIFISYRFGNLCPCERFNSGKGIIIPQGVYLNSYDDIKNLSSIVPNNLKNIIHRNDWIIFKQRIQKFAKKYEKYHLDIHEYIKFTNEINKKRICFKDIDGRSEYYYPELTKEDEKKIYYSEDFYLFTIDTDLLIRNLEND